MCFHLILHLTACETRRPVLLNEQTELVAYHPFEEPPACAHHDERDASMPCASHGACCSVREKFYCYATPDLRCQGWQWYQAVVPPVDEARYLALFPASLHPENAPQPMHLVFHQQRLRLDLFDAGAEAWDAFVQLRRIHAATAGFTAPGNHVAWRWDDNYELMRRQVGSVQAYRSLWMEATELGWMDPCPTQGLEKHPWSIAFQLHDMKQDYAAVGCPALEPVLPSKELVQDSYTWVYENPQAAIPAEQANDSAHPAVPPVSVRELAASFESWIPENTLAPLLTEQVNDSGHPDLPSVSSSMELDASPQSWLPKNPLAAIPAEQTSDSDPKKTRQGRLKPPPLVLEASESPMSYDSEPDSCHGISSGLQSMSFMEMPFSVGPVNYITPFQQGVAPGCRPLLSGYKRPVLAATSASGHWTQDLLSHLDCEEAF